MEGAFVMLKKGWRKRVFRIMPGEEHAKKAKAEESGLFCVLRTLRFRS